MLTSEEVWVGRNQPVSDLDSERKYEYKNTDVLEYAVYGWFRWVGSKPDTWNCLVRVTTNEAEIAGNMEYAGDRAMAIWNGPGYIHLATSHYGSNAGDNWNYVKNWERDSFINDGSWVFVYYGYNRGSKKLNAYLQNGEGNWFSWTVTGARQQVPRQLRVFLGRDYYHMGTSGVLRDWHFVYGPGAHRSEKFEELIALKVNVPA